MKKFMKQLKEKFRKFKSSGCIAGWDREHFRRDESRPTRGACLNKQILAPQTIGLPPHVTPIRKSSVAVKMGPTPERTFLSSGWAYSPFLEPTTKNLEQVGHPKLDTGTESSSEGGKLVFTKVRLA